MSNKIEDINLIEVKSKDILVFKGNISSDFLSRLQSVLFRNNVDVLVVRIPKESSLEVIDELKMNELGWYKKGS